MSKQLYDLEAQYQMPLIRKYQSAAEQERAKPTATATRSSNSTFRAPVNRGTKRQRTERRR